MILRVITALFIGASLFAQKSSISGTIRNAHNQIPIPGVLIHLDDGERPLETFTDAAGHYRFSDIAHAAYTLRIEKEGYLFQPDFALSNQVSIVLDERGEKAEQSLSLDYVMDQWTSLAGCVRDADGKPIADAVITLTPRGVPRGTPETTTNSKGCYEFEQVFPGSYYMEALPPATTHPVSPTFYPATANPFEAQRVPVAPGVARRGIDIRLAKPTLGVISGRTVEEEGKPLPDLQIQINPADAFAAAGPLNVSYRPERFQPPALLRVPPSTFPISEVRMVRSGPDGLFRIEGLVPGAWRLFVQANPRNSLSSARERVELAPPTEDAPETTVVLMARAMFESQLQFDWSGPPPPVTRDIATVFGGLPQKSPSDQPNSAAAPTSLRLPLVSPGTFNASALELSGVLPEGYYFAGIRQGGVDLQGQPAQRTRTSPPITVVFKPNAAQIQGILEGDTAAIVLLWTNNIARELAARTAVARPGENFHFGSLAPGTYHLAAFDRIPPDGLTVPFLNALTPTATTVTLKEGATVSPKLKGRSWLD